MGGLHNHVTDNQTLLIRLIETAQDAAGAAGAETPTTDNPSTRQDAAEAAHLRFVLVQPEAATLPGRELAALPAGTQTLCGSGSTPAARGWRVSCRTGVTRG